MLDILLAQQPVRVMSGKHELSEMEQREFREAVADIKPLPSKPVHKAPKPRPHARFARAAAAEVLQESLTGDPDPDDALLGKGLYYAKPGVQRVVLRKLRRGHFSVTAELNLHGLRIEAARIALAEFLQTLRGTGMRCVRIIHGKGYRSGPRGPVLKINSTSGCGSARMLLLLLGQTGGWRNRCRLRADRCTVKHKF